MADKPCTHTELIARVVALESGLIALKEVLAERDERYKLRSDAQDQAVKTALLNSERAISKAEASTEKRFESVNEFRAQLADQATRLMPRAEYDVQHRALEDKVGLIEGTLEAKISSNETRINAIQRDVTSILARGGGLKEGWGYLVAVIGIVIAAIAVFLRLGK